MSVWAQLTEQIKKIWSQFSLIQKVTIIGVSVIALIGIITLITFSQQPKMDVLFTDLSPHNAGAIVAKLKEQKVNYKLENEGETILVPSKDKYQLRLDLAGNVDLSGSYGFETFNETRFGETDTDKRVRFLVALQGELTRTIEELDEVQIAKVHIALPQPSLFIQEEKEPTASVLLRLKPYAKLGTDQIKSIMAFVSHSVEGLKMENVTVIDVMGNLLSDGIALEKSEVNSARFTANQLVLKQQYEDSLARSVQSMLERMRGPGKAVVRANVSMDFDQVEKLSEIYQDPILVSEHKKEESSKGTTPTTGGNPADANMGGPSYGSVGSTGESEYELTETTKNYEVSKITETVVSAPGKVTQVSLSVLIDGDLVTDEEDKIIAAVSRAAGIDTARGDQVSVVGIPFNTDQIDKLQEQIAKEEAARRRMEYIQMGTYILAILATIGLVVYLLRRFSRQQEMVVAEQAAAGSIVEWEFPVATEDMEKKSMRKQIEKIVETNPGEASKVIKTWLEEE